MEIGLIGYGYWGTNLLRNLLEMTGSQTIHVCDIKSERREKLNALFPKVIVYSDYKELINNVHIKGLIIATPGSTHYQIAKEAIQKNKHVFIEKPMTDNLLHAKELMNMAIERKVCLMVDHVYLYNGAVHKIKELLWSESFGNLQYIDASRINLGIYQEDVNVIWDLAAHDLSIILEILEEKPTHVRTIGKFNALHQREDLAYMFLKFASGLSVQIKSSWASPVKIRQILFGGTKQMIIYDDVEPTQKIKVYDFEAVPVTDEMRNKALIDYRLGDISIPKFSVHEPLKAALNDFFNGIKYQTGVFSDASKAIPVIEILEKATQSLKNDGNWELI